MNNQQQQSSSSSQQVPVQQPSSNQRTMQSNRNRDKRGNTVSSQGNRGNMCNMNRRGNENGVSLWNEMFDSPIDRMFKTFLGDDYDYNTPLSLMNRNNNLGLSCFKANMVEKQNEYQIQADLPGINKQDVHITYKDGTLEIEGKRDGKEEWDENDIHHSEVEYGEFYRSFYLPKCQNINVSDLKAQYNNGVLNIHIPKDKQQDHQNYRVNIE
jgi:HSP20 family protein